jgi:predicted HNH restriction endonuclease
MYNKMKKCFQCKEELELDKFYKNKSTKDGHSGICKNCQTENERKNNQLAKEWLNTLRTECKICGENRSWVLDFHHVNQKDKTFDISYYSISGTTAFETKKKKILEEMEKCIVVCANCHRDIHYQEKTGAYQLNKRNKE